MVNPVFAENSMMRNGRFIAVVVVMGLAMLSGPGCQPGTTSSSALAKTAPVKIAAGPALTGDVKTRLAAVKKLTMEKDPATAGTLVTSLKDEEPLVRRFAIYGLERIGNPVAAGNIMPLVQDQDEWVRRTAVIALGKLKSKEAVPVLLAAIKNPKLGVRTEAFAALGRIGDPASQRAILATVKELDLWHNTECGYLPNILHVFEEPFFTDPAAQAFLRSLLADSAKPHPEFEKLGATEGEQQTTQLCLTDADILADKYADPAGEKWLLASLKDGNSDYVADHAVRALARIKSKQAVPLLVKFMEMAWDKKAESYNHNHRACLVALGEIGDPAAVPALEKFLTHPDYRLRTCAAAALEKIDGRKRTVAPDGPAATPPLPNIPTPGGKLPPQFIVLAVDDCGDLEGVETLVDICETLQANGSKAVFTMFLAPHIGDWKNTDMEKKQLLFQRLFDLGCEVANHTLSHNPGGHNLAELPVEQQVEEVEGCTAWDREHIQGFTRPFTFKFGGGGAGLLQSKSVMEILGRQNFLYWGTRGNHPNDMRWPVAGKGAMIIDTGCLDAGAPPVHATITDPIVSDYAGRFAYDVPQGVAVWQANFDYHYRLPHRPILALNGFHDWGLRYTGDLAAKGSHHNEGQILKAFLLDVLVKNKDKYPNTYCVTYRQVVEYVNTNGDLAQTLAIGNGQDSRNPVKPSVP
jgi:peptidoglycan/xylan/chitin deacetylase (PgdA/CDA1 family)